MKQKKFYDVSQASSYLTHSVIRYKDRPIYVQKVLADRDSEGNRRYLAYYYFLGQVGYAGDIRTVWLDDENIDMNPIPLGMLAPGQESTATIYCSRMPRRAWKIGLTYQALNLSQIEKDSGKRIKFRPQDILISSSLENTILNKYPSIKTATGMSNDKKVPVAFSRSFAVWDKSVYYKDIGLPIGDVVRNRVDLTDQFFWLKEKLNEDLNG